MDTARKIIGLLLIIFIGLPTLFGIIWAVGMIRASVSPEFLSDLPREIIAELPESADEIFRDARSDQFITDDRTRAWFDAAAKTGISPRELLEKTGLMAWMQDEVSDSLRQFGLVLKGERRPRPIAIDLRPLKAALLHPETERFLLETLNQLPPCDEQGMKAWAELVTSGSRHSLPACNPDPDMAKAALLYARTELVEDIDDEFEVIEASYHFPVVPFGFSRMISYLSYLLFLIPAAFIFLGALIGASSPAGVFRWSGISVLAGGVPALILSLGTKFISLWAIKAWPYGWHDAWPTELGDLVMDKLSWIPMRVIDQLFTPVVGVAAIVCLAGIVIYALSFTVRDGARKGKKPASPVPAAEAPKAE
jgi:hypothetical protein